VNGILFDLKHVESGAKDRIGKLGLANRLQVLSGDFFESVPAADGYVMKNIIHDWDDERAIKILNNCTAHLKPGGKVILIETVVIPGNEPHMSKWLDVEMFMLPGGRERSEAEFAALFSQAGLKLSRVVPTKSPMCVIESQKV
jgi:cyclopropane fatty-acyl-phospholipid synthase-like methyltransferase